MNIDKALGVHAEMLAYRTQRTQVLANNIANADTPNYKAKDMTFEAITNSITQENSILSEQLYRIPSQKSADGNTVELHVEQANFAQNMSDYETSLTFLKMKISGLKSAIEGQ